MLIFLHIPKTGGSTLTPVLDWNYDNKTFQITRYTQIPPFIALSDSEKLQYRVLMGQVFYGIHQYIPEESTYITTLRHPIKRLVSQYFYLNIRKQNLGEALSNMPIEQFLELEPFQAYMQLNLIAGGDSLEESLRRPLPVDALERAKANIEKHFPVVGVIEKYDESLLLMKRALGWKRAFYKRINENITSKKFEDLPKSTQSLIQQACEPEMALYEYAQKRIESQLEQVGNDFWRDFEMLKRNNRRFNQFHRLAAPIRHSKLWFFFKGIARRFMS